LLQDELVGTGAPAFLSFDQAAAAFFGVAPSVNRRFGGDGVVVREQDRRARIDSIRIRPAEVIVAVSGEALGGTRLTLGGAAAPSKRLTRRTREVRLPLTSGMSGGAWVALHRDQELLDRRILDPAWRQPGVEIEPDPATQIEVLVARGEGATLEFKRQLPGDDPRGVTKTVSAFANGDGGTLLFGVDDEGNVVGLRGLDLRESVDRLTSIIGDRVRPRVEFTPRVVEIQGVRVLMVSVASGAEPPYGVGTNDRQLTYYVRRGATTSPAEPAEIRAFVRARLPPPT
jgi:hypothetical protein